MYETLILANIVNMIFQLAIIYLIYLMIKYSKNVYNHLKENITIRIEVEDERN